MSWRERYPNTWLSLRWLLLIAVVTYCGVAAVLHAQTATARQGCERGNLSRGATYDDALNSSEKLSALAGQEHDPEIAAIYSSWSADKDQLAQNTVSDSDKLGTPLVVGRLEIDCDAAYPNVLPWVDS